MVSANQKWLICEALAAIIKQVETGKRNLPTDAQIVMAWLEDEIEAMAVDQIAESEIPKIWFIKGFSKFKPTSTPWKSNWRRNF